MKKLPQLTLLFCFNLLMSCVPQKSYVYSPNSYEHPATISGSTAVSYGLMGNNRYYYPDTIDDQKISRNSSFGSISANDSIPVNPGRHKILIKYKMGNKEGGTYVYINFESGHNYLIRPRDAVAANSTTSVPVEIIDTTTNYLVAETRICSGYTNYAGNGVMGLGLTSSCR